jgi:vacuole morphology and inheritance protein 14
MAQTELSQAVLRNLADKLYEKRKAAALEVEHCTRAILHARDPARLDALISMLATDFAGSPHPNHRKAGACTRSLQSST